MGLCVDVEGARINPALQMDRWMSGCSMALTACGQRGDSAGALHPYLQSRQCFSCNRCPPLLRQILAALSGLDTSGGLHISGHSLVGRARLSPPCFRAPQGPRAVLDAECFGTLWCEHLAKEWGWLSVPCASGWGLPKARPCPHGGNLPARPH